MKPNEIRILAVDDELGMLDLIRVLFKKFNFFIETAHSGNQAWEILAKHEFDLVLTDVRMPDGDGIDLAQKIRSKHPSRPSILFMTGFSDLLNEEIFHLGAEGKFTKPFDNNAVRAAITSGWSNGQTEGQITKLKLVKRQMYGRGKLDLLQARLIGSTP